MRRAVFPGSFDPLTVAHLAIADAVVEQSAVTGIDLAISRVALDKETAAQAPVPDRCRAIERHRADRPWLGVVVTDAQLLVDIALGYDMLVVGADKWLQLHDARFYGDSERARDDALARLPELIVVPRGEILVPGGVPLLDLDPAFRAVSSSDVRAGRDEWRA